MDPIALAIAEINAPRPIPIDRETLLIALRSRAPISAWAPHVRAFLEELPIELVHDIVLSGALSFEELATAIQVWECPDADTATWIAEMAALSLESAVDSGARAAIGTAR